MKRTLTIFSVAAMACSLVVMPLSAQTFMTDFGRAVSNLFAPKIEGNGNVQRQTRDFASFHTVRVDAPFGVDIDCVESGQPSVFVQADDNILPLISTTLQNGVLTVSLDKEVNANGLKSKHLKVVVSAPAADKIELLGAGSIQVTNIYRPNCTLELTGVGSIEAAGKTENLAIEAHGVGSISAKHVRAQNARVESHGIGSTSVFASNSLDIDISGIGNLTYYGNPQFVRKSAGGIGSVSKGSSNFQP